MSLAIAILAFVTLERLAELWLAKRNTDRLLARGAYEVGAEHYPIIVGVHAFWLAALWWFASGRPVDLFALALFGLLLIARVWVIASLGDRWTTRIIVLPNAALICHGPYRFMNHPNYWVVIGEIFLLPMVFGLWLIALMFTVLNAAALVIRIRAEEGALHDLR